MGTIETLSEEHGTRLIEAMMQPAFYPHPCDRVELLQTMMSWLMFAGQFVYKIRKPVSFSFVDATTPAKRYGLCRDELALNRRMTSDVHLGVVGITEKNGEFAIAPDASATNPDIREFALIMRRLPQDRMLAGMVADGSISAGEIRALAGKLARLHARAAVPRSKAWGSPQEVASALLTNLARATNIAADNMTRNTLDAVGDFARRFAIVRRQSLGNRVRDGYIRARLGDLRCESVCFDADGIVLMAGIDYGEDSSYADVASELAALAVDLDLADRSDLAGELVDAYAAQSKDLDLGSVSDFYKCYWTTRTMAAAQGLSHMTVHRIWKQHGLQPHRLETFKLSGDRQFVEKLRDVVGLYLNPPDRALVLSVDEKSQIQALDRTQPGLPMKRGRCGTRTHDYKRHGTTTLYAALSMLDGTVIGQCLPATAARSSSASSPPSISRPRPSSTCICSSTTPAPTRVPRSKLGSSVIRAFISTSRRPAVPG